MSGSALRRSGVGVVARVGVRVQEKVFKGVIFFQKVAQGAEGVDEKAPSDSLFRMAALSRPAWQAVSGQKATTGPVKGIAQLVREATDGGRLIIDGLVDIATDPESSRRDRVSAYQVLLDRGFGRAVETSLTLSVDAGSSEALSQLADAELERLAATLAPSTARPVVVLPAAALSVGPESLPDAPPEALEAPLRPPPPVSPPTPPATTTPVHSLPPPLVRAPRRRIVAPPPVKRPVATVDEPQDLVDASLDTTRSRG